ncbi:MAG: cation transporter [Methyloprofundus sp.]|nr:cation transporter [Methyloprofundus sp.]
MTTSVKLTVTGMKCGGCEGAIKKELGSKEGIVSIDTSHVDSYVGVVFDDAIISEDDIIELIEKAGFTVED